MTVGAFSHSIEFATSVMNRKTSNILLNIILMIGNNLYKGLSTVHGMHCSLFGLLVSYFSV